MFFSIGQYAGNFTSHYKHNNLWINTDPGWHTTVDISGNLTVYKGYMDEYPLSDKINEIIDSHEPKYYGNFCVIHCTTNGISIHNDVLRSFPIWYTKNKELTNLVSGTYPIWADSVVCISNDCELIETKIEIIKNKIELSTLSLNQVCEQIDTILVNKISKFVKHNILPINVFISGGLDSMLVYSYIKKLNIPHTLIRYKHTELDEFYLKNHSEIEKFWGYNQFHYWNKDCILTSGAPGDEFTVRSPCTANLILRYYQTSIADLLQQDRYQNCLHYTYFNTEDNFKVWETHKNKQYKSLDDVVKECLNINFNDYQHWHLGKTISYTPLRDDRLFNLICRLSREDLQDQIMDGVVQKTIIKKNAPELIKGLSLQKNADNHMANLTKII